MLICLNISYFVRDNFLFDRIEEAEAQCALLNSTSLCVSGMILLYLNNLAFTSIMTISIFRMGASLQIRIFSFLEQGQYIEILF